MSLKKIATLILLLVTAFNLLAKEYTLTECLKLAKKNSITLQIDQNDIDLYNKKYTNSQNGFWDTEISANSQYSHARNEYSDELRRDYEGSSVNSNISLSLSGQLSKALLNNVQISENNLIAGELNKNNTDLMLEYNTISQYLTVLISKELLKVNKEKVLYSESEYEETKLKYDLGSLTKSDLLESEVALSAANLEITISKNDLNKQKQRLINLISMDIEPDSMKVVTLDSKIEQDEKISIDNLISLAFNNRYDYQSKLLSLNNYKLSLNSEQSTWFPSASVSAQAGITNTEDFKGSYAYQDATQSLKFDSNYNTSVLSVKGSLNWDLTFDDFNSIDQAKLNLKKEQLSCEKLKQDIKSEIKEAYYDYLSEKENLSKVDKHVELAKENLDLANEMFKIGSKTIGERIKAKNDYIGALYKKISARYQFLRTYYALLNKSGIKK